MENRKKVNKDAEALKRRLEEKEWSETTLKDEVKRLKLELRGKNDQLERRVDEQKRTERFEKLLKDKIECPVCLEVPRSGPVPVCPNGHLVCKKCQASTCPTCRSPMGDGKSFLANIVMENVEHSCKYTDCDRNVSFCDIDEHELNCLERKVKCPHVNCRKEVVLNRMVEHLTEEGCSCEDDEDDLRSVGQACWVTEKYNIKHVLQRDVSWAFLHLYDMEDEKVILRIIRSGGQFCLALIGLVSKDICMNYTFRMVVGGPESDSDQSIMFRGNPYSIDENEEDMNL